MASVVVPIDAMDDDHARWHNSPKSDPASISPAYQGWNRSVPRRLELLDPNQKKVPSIATIIRITAAISLTFGTPNGAKQVTFDQVILALPFSVLRKLDFSQAGFDPLKTMGITQLGYGTNSKLYLQFDDRYWNSEGPWGVANA